MKRIRLLFETKSQVLIAVLIAFTIILTLGAAILMHSRSARTSAKLETDIQRAYVLAQSGLTIGDSGATGTYNIGGGTVTVTLDAGKGEIKSEAIYQGSTQTLTKSYVPTTLPPTTWAKSYGTSFGRDRAYLVTQTVGGYILAGDTEKTKKGGLGNGSYDLLLIKVDSAGKKQWAYAYGGSGSEVPDVNTIQKANSGYILATDTYSLSSNSELLMIKVDDNGGLTWASAFQGSSYDRPIAVRQTSDGGYLLSGFTTSFGALGYATLLIKTDSAGKIGLNADPSVKTWARMYDFFENANEFPGDILEDTVTKQYIIAGDIFHSNDYDGIVFGVNADDGVITFQKRFGGANYERFSSISAASDGGYILGGWTASAGAAGSQDNFWLMKIDTSGNKSWDKVYDENLLNQRVGDLKTLSDGYLLSGRSFGAAGTDEILVLKTDLTGNNVLMSKVCGQGSGSETAYSIEKTSDADAGYIFGGYTASYPPDPLFNFMVIKTDSAGELKCVTNICSNPQKLVVGDGNIPEKSGFSLNVSTPSGLDDVNVGPAPGSGIITRTTDIVSGVVETPICE